jgi:LPXTG-motif cell wall-anchored protein
LYTNIFSVPARPAALLGASALVIGGALVAGPAHAVPADGHSGSTGKATAVAARADLDVSVKGIGDVPVQAVLSDVSAPEDSQQTLLTAKVKGMNKNKPVTLVKAKVADSSAKANAQRSVGEVKLVSVRVYAPGLPANPLLSADLLTATALCEAGKKPTAKAKLAENVSVLGKPVTVNGPGDQHVKVPGIGTVDLVLEDATTTDSTGAATALRLKYAVNPTALGVAKASGEIVLAQATCAMPGSSDEGGTEGNSTDGQSAGSNGAEDGGSTGNQPGTQTGDGGENLAETGGNSATPVIAGVGGALVLGGAGMYLIRRRKAAQDN